MADDSTGPEKDRAALDAFFAQQEWVPLSERYPKTGERVLIKMANGSVEIGTWRADAATWSYSPFDTWQMPVSWAPLPPPSATS